jgi:hypothetical protein
VHERELVELLLAEPTLVVKAALEVPLEEVEHPGPRQVIEALYRLHASGQPADLDHLREPLNNETLWSKLHLYQERGESYPDRPMMFQKVIERFRERKASRRKQAIMNKLQDADEATRMSLLRELTSMK